MTNTTNINGRETITGYWDWEVGKDSITVDSTLQILLGYDVNDIHSKRSWREIIKPVYIDALCQKYTEHVESKGRLPFVLEIGLTTKIGNACCILISGRVTEWGQQGEPVKMAGSYLEVTGFIEGEKELRKVKDLLNKTNQAALVGGWELDLEADKLIWTEVTKKIFEVDDDFVPQRGLTFPFFRTAADRAKLKRALDRAITKGIPYDLELKIVTAKGRELWTRSVGQPEFVDGKCVRVYGVFQNINERKLTEQALKQKNEQLQKAVTEKLDFLSIMSHEIRTPMNAVIGFTNLLLQNPREDQLEYLNVLKFSAENLLMLINDILDFNKMEAGKIELESVDIDLREIFKNIRSSQQQEADKKEIAINIDIDNNIPRIIKGDPMRLAQIMTNLIANAIKFTPSGRVDVNVKEIRRTAHNVTLHFEVKDTGIGIAADKLDHIFEKFSQATSETTRKYGGTGLGLTIIKRLLEMVGSKINVRSVPGEGSTFFFELKFKRSKAQLQALTAPVLAPQSTELAGKKVLVVEDNPINVLVINKFLKQWKIEYDVAQNGLIAVEKATKNNYDLILMDLQMPEMDGYDATRAIRKLSDTHKLMPIFALTASAVSDMKVKILEAGMNECVNKPFKPDELHGLLTNYLIGEPIPHVG